VGKIRVPAVQGMKILFLNGPNLNMLGTREKNIYGNLNLEEINSKIELECKKNDVACEFFQSNIEGELIDKIHSAINCYDGIVFNPGAYSHYSLAISDAIKAISVPVVEVHISNVFAREDSRHQMVTAKNSLGVISGFSYNSYILGLYGILNYVK
jgi:3-dehydroquinate dehydratase-2